MDTIVSLLAPRWRPSPLFLTRMINSVVKQDTDGVELVICDDASEDPVVSNVLAMAGALANVRIVESESIHGLGVAARRAYEEAHGEFVGFVTQHDSLSPGTMDKVLAALGSDPGIDVLYTDEEVIDLQDVRTRADLKPDWSPELLLSAPYLGHLLLVRRTLLESVGGPGEHYPDDDGYDIMLRSTEAARRIAHVPAVGYASSDPGFLEPGEQIHMPWSHGEMRRSLEEALARRGEGAWVESGPFPCTFRVRWPVPDGVTVTEVVVDHEKLGWRDAYAAADSAAKAAPDGYLCFRHADTHANTGRGATGGWRDALLELACRAGTGVVGGRLCRAGGTVTHTGIGITGTGPRWFTGAIDGKLPSAVRWAALVHDCAAVSSAACMTSTAVYRDIGGFDPAMHAYADVDYCLRVREAGLSVVCSPFATAMHVGAAGEGYGAADESGLTSDDPTGPPSGPAVDHSAATNGRDRFMERWGDWRDPFIHPRLDPADPRLETVRR